MIRPLSDRLFLRRFAILMVLAIFPLTVCGQIQLGVNEPDYGSCGFVLINGGVGSDTSTITDVVWDWGDGNEGSYWFPAEHDYEANGEYLVQVTAYDEAGASLSAHVFVIIENAADDGCDLTIRLYPSSIYLRDGKVSEQLRVEIRDRFGRVVDPATQDIQFEVTVDDIGDLAVSETGDVSASGYGQGIVSAFVGQSERHAQAYVFAGHLRTRPVFQYLSVNGRSEGRIWADMGYADGTPIAVSEHELEWRCTGCGPGEPLRVGPDGTVTVVGDYEAGDPAPLAISAVVDGEWAQDEAVIHVSEEDLGLELITYVQPDTVIVSPLRSAGYDFDAVITEYRMPELFQRGLEVQKYLLSGIWSGGGRAGVVNYTSHYRFDGVFPGCAGSGNPIRMGTNMDEPQSSCFFFVDEQAQLSPKWGTLFHELGHGFTIPFPLFTEFLDVPDGHWFAYSEGLATAAGMFTCEALISAGDTAGVTDKIAQSMIRTWLCWRHLEAGHPAFYSLNQYVQDGADYAQIEPNVIDDILRRLVEEFDFGLIYRLFGMFTPDNESHDGFAPTTVEEQAAMFAIGCSVAAGVSLKDRFRDEWGFPIDDDTWDEMYPMVERRIKARYPASYAGEDRTIEPGASTLLDDAFVFDREQDELTLEWRIISQPAGGNAHLSATNVLNPVFNADVAGRYKLGLSASDQWAQGDQDEVQITVLEAGSEFEINPGLNDAWFDPSTDGQGVLISVLPDSGIVFLTWFTYDTEMPSEDAVAFIGDPGHRWLTAQGAYAKGQAVMDITITRGGIFDAPSNVSRTSPPGADGTLVLTFDNCYSGRIEYDIPSIARKGSVAIQRIVNDNVSLCEELAQGVIPARGDGDDRTAFSVNDDMNPGLNDAWYNPLTDGQGFMLSVLPEASIVFVAWFTYDIEQPSEGVWANLGDAGHRWLTAQGSYEGIQAVMDLTVTSGGLFNYSSEISRTDPPGSDGTMTLTFQDCYSGTIEYEIPSVGKQGTIPIQRIANDNAPLCEMLIGK